MSRPSKNCTVLTPGGLWLVWRTLLIVHNKVHDWKGGGKGKLCFVFVFLLMINLPRHYYPFFLLNVLFLRLIIIINMHPLNFFDFPLLFEWEGLKGTSFSNFLVRLLGCNFKCTPAAKLSKHTRKVRSVLASGNRFIPKPPGRNFAEVQSFIPSLYLSRRE